MKHFALALILAAGGISACSTSYPERTVIQGGEQAYLWFSDAPLGAELRVDGLHYGSVAPYDGTTGVLEVAPGHHRVEIIVGTNVLYDREIFAGQGARLEIDIQ